MSLYQCEKCGCIENTALGFYWSRHDEAFRERLGEDFGKALCSECMPCIGNGIFKEGGKWHGKFEKEIFPLGTLETNPNTGNIREKKKPKSS